MAIPQRTMGTRGPLVGALGLGCLSLTGQYGERPDDAVALRTVQEGLDAGVTLLDTADAYGPFINEEFVGRAIRGRRDEVQVATKFGVTGTAGSTAEAIRGDAEWARRSCDASLRRLAVDVIDIYYLHRPDPKVPIEETIGAMAELVDQGKIRHIGVCEPSAETLRRAHAVHPLVAVQSEWSLWTREIEFEVLPEARRLGIGIVPFAPLGRGFLTGQIRSLDDIPPDDSRRTMPRFQSPYFERNLAIVEAVEGLAETIGCTPAQLAIAWLLHQGGDVIPIPGADRPSHVTENCGAISISLRPQELAAISEALPVAAGVGDRYSDMSWSAGDTPPADERGGATP